MTKYLIMFVVASILVSIIMLSPLSKLIIVSTVLIGILLLMLFEVYLIEFILLLFCLFPPVYIYTIDSINISDSGPIKNHPVTVILIISFLYILIFNADSLREFYLRSPSYIRISIYTQLMFILLTFSTCLFNSNLSTASFLSENFLGPYILFLLICTQFDTSKCVALQKFYISICFVVSIYGITEYLLHSNYLYGNVLYNTMEGYSTLLESDTLRIMTTFGHALVTAHAMLLALLFTINLYKSDNSSSVLITYLLIIVFILTIFLTSSRSALFILLIFLLYLYKNNISFKSTLFTLFITSAITSVLFYIQGAAFINRFTSREGILSSAVRLKALLSTSDIIKSSQLFDASFRKSKILSDNLVAKGISFEIPWLMILVDLGIIPTMLYITSIISLTIGLLKLSRLNKDGNILAIISIVSLIMLSGYSSFAEKNLTNILFWFPAALALCHVNNHCKFRVAE